MTDSAELTSLHAVVEGHVQGVGFRYFVKENAELLHLTGWVRNRYDGTVEFAAEGDRADLDRLVAAVKSGPSRSIVTNVVCDWSQSPPKYSQFSFLPTE
jgi:acylphosphatase